MNITLKQLQAFVEVAQQGSFTRAAKRLHVSQPALTVTVRELERDLGVRLFDRTTRKVQLTQEGAGFLPTAERLLNDVRAAVEDVREVAERRRGQVRLVSLPSVATDILPAILADFGEQYPGITVHLHDANASGVQTRVKNREVDFGVASVWQQDEDLTFTPLMADTFHLVCRSDHPLAASGEPVRWSDLADWVFLGLAPDTGIRPLLETVPGLPMNMQRPRYEVSNIATLDGLLGAGMGITVLPRLAVPRSARAAYVVRPVVGPELSREIGLIQMRNRSLSPAADTLATMIREGVPVTSSDSS
jgi:DNA-binding transcriptional LysR family regulator